MEYSLEWRKQRAMQLRKEGYNCAQAVALAFPDISKTDDNTMARLCAALGSGVAASGEICGVCNAMAILAGATTGADASDKIRATKTARPLLQQFASLNGSRMRCTELKSATPIRPCNELILQGIEIIHNSLSCQDNA